MAMELIFRSLGRKSKRQESGAYGLSGDAVSTIANPNGLLVVQPTPVQTSQMSNIDLQRFGSLGWMTYFSNITLPSITKNESVEEHKSAGAANITAKPSSR